MRVAMGEDEQQGRSNPGLLSDVCEAVIAALYLDGGLPAAKQFIAAAWTARIEADREAPSDPKTELQEWAQARGQPLPRYSEVRSEEHTSELQSLMRISYAVFCLQKKT